MNNRFKVSNLLPQRLCADPSEPQARRDRKPGHCQPRRRASVRAACAWAAQCRVAAGSGSRRRGAARKLQRHGRPLSQSFARQAQRAPQFLRRQGPAVEAKAVPILPGRESIIEHSCQILRGDADSIVADGNPRSRRAVRHPHGQTLVGVARFDARMVGVGDQVYQDLQHLVLVEQQRRHFGVSRTTWICCRSRATALNRSASSAKSVSSSGSSTPDTLA